jgi:Ca-activated chloride channel family protein
MLSFAWPWAFLALPLPLLARRLLPEAGSLQEAGLRVPGFAGFGMLANRAESEQLLNWRFWVAAIAWILLVVAAARPEHIGDELDVPVSGRNLMLAVDLSGSMDQKDFELGNTRVDRLTATKAVASDFISRREGDRIGLILFGERAYLQVPLTLDRETVKTLLLEAFIGLAGEKTAIGDAITLAVKRIHDQSSGTGQPDWPAGLYDRYRGGTTRGVVFDRRPAADQPVRGPGRGDPDEDCGPDRWSIFSCARYGVFAGDLSPG